MELAFCKGINYKDESVRSAAALAAKSHPGSYNFDQVLDIWAYVKANIDYISDPNTPQLENLPYAAGTTLKNKAGDCDDQAVLLAAMVEAIGGTARVKVNFDCGHAYTEVYIGNTRDSITYVRQYIWDRYPYAYVRTWGDEDGSYWVILDPAGAYNPGDLHPDCVYDYDSSWDIVGTSYPMYSCVN
jgi:transglutaminase-like putative cysteine protease